MEKGRDRKRLCRDELAITPAPRKTGRRGLTPEPASRSDTKGVAGQVRFKSGTDQSLPDINSRNGRLKSAPLLPAPIRFTSSSVRNDEDIQRRITMKSQTRRYQAPFAQFVPILTLLIL